MTAQILCHRIRQKQAAAPGSIPTARLSRKRCRLLLSSEAVNRVCLFLCGACTAISILILACLAIGG